MAVPFVVIGIMVTPAGIESDFTCALPVSAPFRGVDDRQRCTLGDFKGTQIMCALPAIFLLVTVFFVIDVEMRLLRSSPSVTRGLLIGSIVTLPFV